MEHVKLREHHYDLNLSHSDMHAHTDFGEWKHMSDRWSEDTDMNTCLSLVLFIKSIDSRRESVATLRLAH